MINYIELAELLLELEGDRSDNFITDVISICMMTLLAVKSVFDFAIEFDFAVTVLLTVELGRVELKVIRDSQTLIGFFVEPAGFKLLEAHVL